MKWFIGITQLFLMVCLFLGVLGMDRLRRFLKAVHPEIYKELHFPGMNWLRYNFDRRDKDQVNIRRLKGVLSVHFIFAFIFWLV